MNLWVGVTDNDWDRFLSQLPNVDEVNFWQPGGTYRLFYCFRPGNRILVLHGFIKKSQATPKRELDLARKRMKEV